jgi:RimJ/RimL family protein N-acetyltransferase
MTSSNTPQPPQPKHSIPPSWYKLRTSASSQPYIALPSTASLQPIFLTTFQLTDASALQAVLDIPSINDSLISIPKPYTLADANFWINLQLSGTTAPWLQALRSDNPETGTFIGAVSLVPTATSSYRLPGLDGIERQSSKEYVLGYYLHPEFQQRGIMRDAVLALVAWAVAEQGVREVRADVAVENVGSRRLVESLEGFERVEGEEEMVWPESKGGGRKRVWSWRWRSEGGLESSGL